jgi:hypothetical protein
VISVKDISSIMNVLIMIKRIKHVKQFGNVIRKEAVIKFYYGNILFQELMCVERNYVEIVIKLFLQIINAI